MNAEQQGFITQSEEEIPQYLYKIISLEQWEVSQVTSEVALSPMDEAFIHFSKEDQVEHVVKKYWKATDYIILAINPKKLPGTLIYETNPGGTVKYYHLYQGSIPIDSIVKATFFESSEGD